MHRVLAVLLSLATPAWGDGDKAGDFDYYVLALSWSPNWCLTSGNSKGADQCDPDRDLGFTLHGLWPQYDTGWPSYCRTTARDPSRRQTAAMADIMGSGGLAWHQWKKHGRCSGLSAAAYFELSRRAYEATARPQIFRDLPRTLDIPPPVIEAAFLEANPELRPDMVTVTCRSDRLQEVRICLDPSLSPRTCGPDVVRDCDAAAISVAPIR